jgi:hypothetical protein
MMMSRWNSKKALLATMAAFYAITGARAQTDTVFLAAELRTVEEAKTFRNILRDAGSPIAKVSAAPHSPGVRPSRF